MEQTKKSNQEHCSAKIQFGDDYGDNHSTFHCQLKSGHEGKHKESGDMGFKDVHVPYTLEWEGDNSDKNEEDEYENPDEYESPE